MRSTGSKLLTRLYCLTLIIAFLWLGGVGCATCCASEQIILPADRHLVPSATLATERTVAESCSAEMDCCKKAASPRPSTKDEGINRPASAASEISESSSVIACRLLPKCSPGFVTLKFTLDNAAEDLAENSLPCVSTAIEKGLSDSRLTLPQNRSGTYLRCCVFLI